MSESLTAFAPVPSATNRHDGWTPERQRLFIRNLARIGVVSAAARAVGMSPKSAYALLRRAGDDSGFAFAWRKALRASRTTVLCAAVDRALNGVETPVFVRGRRVATRVSYDDRLLVAALRRIVPDRYGAISIWSEEEMEDG
jgi:hypothetical protein